MQVFMDMISCAHGGFRTSRWKKAYGFVLKARRLSPRRTLSLQACQIMLLASAASRSLPSEGDRSAPPRPLPTSRGSSEASRRARERRIEEAVPPRVERRSSREVSENIDVEMPDDPLALPTHRKRAQVEAGAKCAMRSSSCGLSARASRHRSRRMRARDSRIAPTWSWHSPQSREASRRTVEPVDQLLRQEGVQGHHLQRANKDRG